MDFRRILMALGAGLLVGLLVVSASAAAQVTLDTDGDGLMDEQELEIGADPNVPDTDGDGFGDGDEIEIHGFDPLDPVSRPQAGESDPDTDHDGLTDAEEAELGTDPNDIDTDDDGFGDGDETNTMSGPLDPNNTPNSDNDGDGLSNAEEIMFLTSPVVFDTDGDGFGDGEEVFYGANPLDPDSFPVDASITVKAFVCPVGFDDKLLHENCTTLAADVVVDLVQVGADYRASATIDAAGAAVFGDLWVGSYVLNLGVPGDVADFEASCGVGRGEELSNLSTSSSNQIEVPVPLAGDAVTCTWFIIPVDAGQDELSTVVVDVRLLPAEYDGNDYWGDSKPLGHVEVEIGIYGSEWGAAAKTDVDGRVVFDELGEAEYVVALGVPGDFATFITVFGAEDGFEPRQHENPNTNHPVAYVGPDEVLYGAFFVIPVDAGAEPEPTKPQPVKELPNTGAGSLDSGGAADGTLYALLVGGALLTFAGVAAMVRRRT